MKARVLVYYVCTMKVSVVIPAYNEEKFLPLLLASLKKQTYKGDFEIVVADNNSTDRTAEIARSYGAKVFKEPKQGYAYACNRAFFSGTGDILARADADHVLPPNWIQSIVDVFEKDPDLLATGGPIYPYSNNFLSNIFSYPGQVLWMLFLKTIGHGFLFPNMAVRATAFKKINGFDTTIHYGEDTDLCLRLKKLGKVTYNINIYAYTSMRRYYNMGFFKFVFGYAFGNELAKMKKKSTVVGMEVIRKTSHKDQAPQFAPWVFLLLGTVVYVSILSLLFLTITVEIATASHSLL